MSVLKFLAAAFAVGCIVAGCSTEEQTTTTEDIIVEGTDAHLVGNWREYKYIENGSTVTVNTGELYQLKADGSYRYELLSIVKTGTWKTSGNSLTLVSDITSSSPLINPTSRSGTYSVTDTEFVFTVSGIHHYYRKE